MKKTLCLILSLALLFAALPAGAAALGAHPYGNAPVTTDESGVWKYAAMEDGTAYLISYLGPGGEVAVPAALDGRPVTVVGNNAFGGGFEKTLEESASVTGVTIPEGVRKLGSGVFTECTSLTHVSLPASLTELGSNCFFSCTALTTLTVAPGNSAFQVIDNVLYSADGDQLVFCPVTFTGAFTVPAGVKSIGYHAFHNCDGITQLLLPQGLESLGSFCFAGCDGLTEITIPGSVRDVGQVVLSGCKNLHSATLGEGVSTVGLSMFSECPALAEVHLPASLEMIGLYAFTNTPLKDVWYAGTETQWTAVNGVGALDNVTLHCNSASAPPDSAPGAFAVVRSSQYLIVDNLAVDCDKYNIDGSNYFKLRDLAYLLRDTGSRFSVEWDASRGAVSIVTGQTYAPDGSEMLVGEDKSDTAVRSAQSVYINGVARADLSVYNIGGNNFFKLRDLGAALGFDVSYNEIINTAFVRSR